MELEAEGSYLNAEPYPAASSGFQDGRKAVIRLTRVPKFYAKPARPANDQDRSAYA